jgi:2-oxoisovalerate dehydrogenase E2 component (dihydrolipoyl transacylase)
VPLAAATPRGLIVPEVRDADSLSLNELAVALTQLIDTAREGKTTLYMLNGTITITNVGVFGEIKVRKVLQLSLSVDHRVVDGQQGSEFLADVGALLADSAVAISY